MSPSLLRANVIAQNEHRLTTLMFKGLSVPGVEILGHDPEADNRIAPNGAIAFSFYCHLLSALVLVGHGIYVLICYGFRSRKTVIAYFLASVVGAIAAPNKYHLLNRQRQQKSFLSQQRPVQFYRIGMTGFEPAAPSSRTKCATKLRYIPKMTATVICYHVLAG